MEFIGFELFTKKYLTESSSSEVKNGFCMMESAPNSFAVGRYASDLSLPPPDIAIINGFGFCF